MENFGFLFLVCAVFPLIIMQQGLHTIDEGHIGVYFRGGDILDGTSDPGWHTKLPFITTYEQVQVSLQTDKVNNVPCGTSGGVQIMFDQIEVVNKLRKDLAQQTVKNYTVNYDKTWIFDKIHHEINQFCSKHTLQEVFIDEFDSLDEKLAEALQESTQKWAPGVEIISIRVTKPIIPTSLMKNYENIESQLTQFKLAQFEQKVREQKAETARIEARVKAESEAEIAAIEMQRKVTAKDAQKKMEDIENTIYTERAKAKADANHYSLMKTIEAEQAQLTPQYLQKLAIQSFTQNTKIYFGESIPKFISDNITDGLKSVTGTPELENSDYSK